MVRSTALPVVGLALAAVMLTACSGGGAATIPQDGELYYEGTYSQTQIIWDGEREQQEQHEGTASAHVMCTGGSCELVEILIGDGQGTSVVFFNGNPPLEPAVAFSLDPEPTLCSESIRFDFPQGMTMTGEFSGQRLALQLSAPLAMEKADDGNWCSYAPGMELDFEGTTR